MTAAQTGKNYVLAALKVAMGAGAVFGTGYLCSKAKERQEAIARLDRLERLVEQLSASDAASSAPPVDQQDLT
jgi:hypothetical protein